jgi:nitroimidazol reductase NimA-like FMN-containing flavoprotein (pyridoxamine 5'-phosphate oxidase superfamily)
VRTTVRRLAERGRYDQDTINAVLDEARVCHVGFAVDGQPYVIPTLHVRVDDHLYLHGAPANQMLRTLRDGVDACVTVTLIDGLVLSRSWFHTSVNYRSVVVLGRAFEVSDPGEKRVALRALVEHVIPGRSDDARPPTDSELRATLVLALPLAEASAKVRTGPAKEEPADLPLRHWSGVVPLALQVSGPPQTDADTPADVEVPDYVTRLAAG